MQSVDKDGLSFGPIGEESASEVLEIYRPYVEKSPATYEIAIPSIADIRRRIRTHSAISPWFGCRSQGKLVGYAYASSHREREGYQWVVEVSCYISPEFHRRGLGRRLYEQLFQELENRGFVQLLAGISLPNAASVGLHEALGFRKVAEYPQIGFKQGAWQSAGWWQKTLEQNFTKSPRKPLRNIAKVRKELSGGLCLVTGSSQMDIDAVYAFLRRTPWAEKRSRDTVARSVQNSLCYGVFDGDCQVAFARVVTDQCTFAYLCDVFVAETYRGRGLSKEMMQAIVADPDLTGLRRFCLATRDAHGLYARYGFRQFEGAEAAKWMGITVDGV